MEKKLLFLLILVISLCGCQKTGGGTSFLRTENSINTYVCTGEQCIISCSINCNAQNPQSVVKFRTSDISFSSGWIAFDKNNDGLLEGYDLLNGVNQVPHSPAHSCQYPQYAWTVISGITTPQGYQVAIYNDQSCKWGNLIKNDIIILRKVTVTSYETWHYRNPSSSAVLTTLPLDEYSGKESYTNRLYNCENRLVINGALRETLVWNSDLPGIKSSTGQGYPSTLNGEATCQGTVQGNIKSDVYGFCGECVPETYTPNCIDDVTLRTCQYVNQCGKYVDTPMDNDYICKDGLRVRCNDNDVCTADARRSPETQCSFTPIANCCKSSSECSDDNACTTDSCTNNRCSNVQNPTCCSPQCTTNYECKNQVCTLKPGCQFHNPNCPEVWQECLSNACVPKTTGIWCANRDEKDCSGVQIRECKQYMATQANQWTTPSDCTNGKYCTTVSGLDDCRCPLPSDGQQWCTQADYVNNAKRCNHFPESVEQCNYVNDCYQWQQIQQCTTGFICVE